MNPKGIVEETNIFTELKIYIHTNCYNKTTTEIILNAMVLTEGLYLIFNIIMHYTCNYVFLK